MVSSASVTLVLGLVLLAGYVLPQAHAVSASCLAVPAASSDESPAAVQFMKSNAVQDALCPGMTYTVALTFPVARTYSVVATKGAFQGASGSCVNRATGTAAVKRVDNLKLYLGCAATGNVKISVLSKAPTDAGLLLKTVSKPIKALSACPQSPCVKDSTASAPAPTTTTPTPATPSALNITGNPMVDMMSVMSMLAGSSGLGATPLGMLLNYQTAMTVISGLTSLKDKGVEAASAIKTIQTLLNMVPASSDPTGFVPGMKNFLVVAQGYLPTTAESTTTQQQMSGALLDVVSSMAQMAGVAATGNGNGMMAMLPMLNMMNSVSTLMSLMQTVGTPAIGVPPIAGSPTGTTSTTPSTTTTTTESGASSSTTTTPSTTTDASSGSTTTDSTTTTTDSTTTTTTESGTSSSTTTTPSTTTDASSGSTTTDSTTTTTDSTTTTTTDSTSGSTTPTTIAAGEPNGSSAPQPDSGSAPADSTGDY